MTGMVSDLQLAPRAAEAALEGRWTSRRPTPYTAVSGSTPSSASWLRGMVIGEGRFQGIRRSGLALCVACFMLLAFAVGFEVGWTRRAAQRPGHSPDRCKVAAISNSTCADFGWLPITDPEACEGAAIKLQLTFTRASLTGAPMRPHGCYFYRHALTNVSSLWVGTNTGSWGVGVENFPLIAGRETRELLCTQQSDVAGNDTLTQAVAPRIAASIAGNATPGSCASLAASRRSTNRSEDLPGLSFPEIDYIYVPEFEKDRHRAQRMQEELDESVRRGRHAIRLVEGVNPALWPGKGRRDAVERFGKQLWLTEGGGDSTHSWWSRRNLRYAEIDSRGRTTCESHGDCHHVGCGLSHLITWMDARQRGLPAIVVAESDGFPSRFQQFTGGDMHDFDSVIPALLEEAPKGWHFIQLDKGTFGVRPGLGPTKTMSRDGWSHAYDIYRWTGRGVAGLALYMVSARFLEQVPRMLHKHAFDMVDAYMDLRCEEDGGDLQCYSIKAVTRPSVGPIRTA
mmetsp:Transcript_86654/g.280557  ORF Transcript_86654/g.280557 Transcript_86654/m.280557 type:complete len:511 (+) Transcript_86654:112-1644(+)